MHIIYHIFIKFSRNLKCALLKNYAINPICLTTSRYKYDLLVCAYLKEWDMAESIMCTFSKKSSKNKNNIVNICLLC